MMSSALLKGLSEEKVVLVKPSQAAKFAWLFAGIVRLVDAKGKTLGVVLDRETLEEIDEDLDALNPKFLESLEASRRSGRIPGEVVRRKAGLA